MDFELNKKRDMSRKFLLILVLLAEASLPLFSRGATREMFDLDGTLFNDHGSQAAWRTDWVLVRVDSRHSALQDDPSQPITLKIPVAGNTEEISVLHPPELRVSYGEYRTMRNLLADGDGHLGSLDVRHPIKISPHPYLVNQPVWILPGLYRIDPAITFQRYQIVGRQFRGNTPLLEDYLQAVELSARTALSENPLHWEGPAFKRFQTLCSNKKNRDVIAVNTARGVSREQMNELFARMVRDGVIKYSPESLGYTLHAAGDPSTMAIYGRGPVEHRKSKAVELEAKQLLRAPFKKHLELAVDLKRARLGLKDLLHVLIVHEDDSTHSTNIGNLMSELSMRGEYKFNIKFILHQVMDAHRSDRWKFEYTVFSSGIGREALPSEIEDLNKETACASLLDGEAR